MKFLVGLVVGAIIAAAIGAAALAYANKGLSNIKIADRDKADDASKTVELMDFESIDAAGVFELEVTVGPEYRVELSGKPDDLERVQATVEGGELKLDLEKREAGEQRHRHSGVTAKISTPMLKAIEFSGVVDGEISGVNAESFKVEISGVGDVELSGTCGALNADVSGVGDLDAQELQCKSVDVTVSGVGDASVYASDSVEATVSGMGDISIYGSPKSVEKSGGMFSKISVK
jgi:hypothetical protein